MGRLQGCAAYFGGEVAGGLLHGLLEQMGEALDTKVGCTVPGFDDAFGDEEQAVSRLEGLYGRLVGEMGEEAKGKGDIPEEARSIGVAEDGGLAAGVDLRDSGDLRVLHVDAVHRL